MKKTTNGTWIFFAVSFCSPLLYLLMYLPIWNGKELYLTSDNPFPIIIFVAQIIALVCSITQLCFRLFKKEDSFLFSIIFLLLTVFSMVSLCFVGCFFILELLNIPWFPSQS